MAEGYERRVEMWAGGRVVVESYDGISRVEVSGDEDATIIEIGDLKLVARSKTYDLWDKDILTYTGQVG